MCNRVIVWVLVTRCALLLLLFRKQKKESTKKKEKKKTKERETERETERQKKERKKERKKEKLTLTCLLRQGN